MLVYWISIALADFALASVVISGTVTTILVAGVYWIDRRRPRRPPPDRARAQSP
jgi:hypothetical protein